MGAAVGRSMLLRSLLFAYSYRRRPGFLNAIELHELVRPGFFPLAFHCLPLPVVCVFPLPFRRQDAAFHVRFRTQVEALGAAGEEAPPEVAGEEKTHSFRRAALRNTQNNRNAGDSWRIAGVVLSGAGRGDRGVGRVGRGGDGRTGGEGCVPAGAEKRLSCGETPCICTAFACGITL